MSSFMGLVWNEWLKLYKKKSFFIAFAIMAVITIVSAIAINQTVLGETMGSADYINLVLALNGFGSLFVLIGIIGTASIVSMEHHLGTIKFLLIRANSRSKILASKYVTLILYLVVLMVFTAVLALLMGMILLDTSNFSWSFVLKNVGSTFLYALVYCTITFMFSTITRSTGATIGIGMFLNFCEGIFVMLLNKYEWAKFTLFFNTNLAEYINGGAPKEGMTLAFSSVVLAIYMIVFLAITFAVYNKRDI